MKITVFQFRVQSLRLVNLDDPVGAARDDRDWRPDFAIAWVQFGGPGNHQPGVSPDRPKL